MDILGLQGGRVRLVPPDRALHLENALRWMNDPAVTATLEVNFGVSRRAEEAFFDRIETRREDEIHWAIHAEDLDLRHVGFISFITISWRHRLAVGGLFVGDRDAWGRGYATDAVRVRSRFAFEQMGLHRIEGHTISPAMARVYQKCGYVREGTARQKIWRDGCWQDAALYALLDADQAGGAAG